MTVADVGAAHGAASTPAKPLKCEVTHTCSQEQSCRLPDLEASARGVPMTTEDEPVICAICNRGRVMKRMEQFAFHQMSDKGYVHCRVSILIGTCDSCHAKSIDD